MKNLRLNLVLVGLMLTMVVIGQKPAKMPVGKSFIIQSAQNYGRNGGGCWDVSGSFSSESDFVKGKNIQIWNVTNEVDRVYTIKSSNTQGYYEIMVGRHSVARVDISGGKQKKGANIQLWEDNNGTAQRFLFRHLGNGRFKIYSTNGYIINLKNTNSNNNNNIQLWSDHNGIHNEWFLLDPTTRKKYVPTANVQLQLKGEKIPRNMYYIQSAISYGRNNMGCWDIPGKGASKLKKGANLQIWQNDYAIDRKFYIVKNSSGQYYNIRVGNTGYSVDLFGGKTANGSNIGVYTTDRKNANQAFYFKHLGNGRFKMHHSSGKILAITGGGNNNGQNIHLWDNHNAIHAEWFLINVKTGKAFIPGGSPTNNNSDAGGWDGEGNNNNGGTSGAEEEGW